MSAKSILNFFLLLIIASAIAMPVIAQTDDEKTEGATIVHTDITGEVEQLVPLVPNWVEEAVRVMTDGEPDIDVGAHCTCRLRQS